MQVYNLGPSELQDWAIDKVKAQWFVYSYYEGDYYGQGQAVALGLDGKLRILNLSANSNIGPIEEGIDDGRLVEIEDFLRELDSVHGYLDNFLVELKVLELLGIVP